LQLKTKGKKLPNEHDVPVKSRHSGGNRSPVFTAESAENAEKNIGIKNKKQEYLGRKNGFRILLLAIYSSAFSALSAVNIKSEYFK
jgi:hypothetical protein